MRILSAIFSKQVNHSYVGFTPPKVLFASVTRHRGSRSRRRQRQPFVLGFTLVDLVVAMAIFAILSTLVLVNFRAGRNKDELMNSARLSAQLIRLAQGRSMAGSLAYSVAQGKQVVPPCGYGIWVSRSSSIDAYGAGQPNNRALRFFADFDEPASSSCGASFGSGELLPGEGLQVLADNVRVKDILVNDISLSSGVDQAELGFQPPLGERHVRYGSTDATSGTLTIIFEHQTSLDQARVVVNIVSGLVSVEP